MNEQKRKTEEMKRVGRVIGELIQYCAIWEDCEHDPEVDSYPQISVLTFFKLVVRT